MLTLVTAVAVCKLPDGLIGDRIFELGNRHPGRAVKIDMTVIEGQIGDSMVFAVALA